MGRSSEEKRCQQAGLVNLNIPHLKILRWGILISRYINIAHPGYNTIFLLCKKQHVFGVGNLDIPGYQYSPPQDCPLGGQSWGGESWGYSLTQAHTKITTHRYKQTKPYSLYKVEPSSSLPPSLPPLLLLLTNLTTWCWPTQHQPT